MVRVAYLHLLNMSISMLWGQSPKITYQCGCCGCVDTTRIPLDAIELGAPYIKCPYCGTINDTGLSFD